MLLEAAHRYDRPVGFGCFIGCERINAPRGSASPLCESTKSNLELEIFGAQIRENVNGPLYYVGK